MSTFEVKVYKLKIEPHNNADALELAIVGDYRSCVRKGDFSSNDYGVYIPEGSVLPAWLIERLGLVGKLAGSNHNRVKAVKLRGVLSQGLIYPLHRKMDGLLLDQEGDNNIVVQPDENVTELLGITKYEPPIPIHMAGEVWNAFGYTLSYDIENIKKYPDILQDGESVLITEKLHGTWTCFGYHPEISHPIVTSKGMSAGGRAFKFNEANADNLYIRSLVNTSDADGNDALNRLQKELVSNLPVYILGETYGKGVQDLHYGLTKPHFRAFDIYVGKPGEGRYMNGEEFLSVCRKAAIETVPVLWHGPFSKETLNELTNGKDNVTGSHMREGVVVRPFLEERRDDEIGRVILKSVSEAYLLRKGDATEYN